MTIEIFAGLARNLSHNANLQIHFPPLSPCKYTSLQLLILHGNPIKTLHERDTRWQEKKIYVVVFFYGLPKAWILNLPIVWLWKSAPLSSDNSGDSTLRSSWVSISRILFYELENGEYCYFINKDDNFLKLFWRNKEHISIKQVKSSHYILTNHTPINKQAQFYLWISPKMINVMDLKSFLYIRENWDIFVFSNF